MPARMILSVTRLVTFAARGNPAVVGRTTELLIEPRSTYRYSSLALQLLANMVSMPAPTVQPKRSVFLDAALLIGTPVAVTVETARSVFTLPNAPPPVA